MLTELSTREFMEALASKAAVPGGGGAAALVCAAAAALDSMVGRLTLGKAKYAAVQTDMERLTAEADELRGELLQLVEADAEAFEPLSRAYGIPKDDPSRAAVMEQALRAAAEPPMQILRACGRGIELSREMAEKGSVLAVSDAGCAAVFFWAGMYAAALNVRVNTKSMTDRAHAEALNTEAEQCMDQYWPLAEEIYKNIYGRLS